MNGLVNFSERGKSCRDLFDDSWKVWKSFSLDV